MSKCSHQTMVLGCDLEEGELCDGKYSKSCPDYNPIEKDDSFDTEYFDIMKQASKEAEKPMLRLTRSQLRKIFRKLN